MEWKTEHEYLGSEFDFVASDLNGEVGYFTSAGFGPIPVKVLEVGAAMYGFCEDVAKMKKVSQVEILSKDSNIEDWVTVAEIGFYAYDWSHENNLYQLVARPIKPLLVSGINCWPKLFDLVKSCRLDNDVFSGPPFESIPS